MNGRDQIIDTTPDWLVELFNQTVLKPALYLGINVLVLDADVLPNQSIIRYMNAEHIVDTVDLMVTL